MTEKATTASRTEIRYTAESADDGDIFLMHLAAQGHIDMADYRAGRFDTREGTLVLINRGADEVLSPSFCHEHNCDVEITKINSDPTNNDLIRVVFGPGDIESIAEEADVSLAEATEAANEWAKYITEHLVQTGNQMLMGAITHGQP